MFHNHGFGYHPALIPHEILQQGELPGLQFDLDPLARHGPAEEVYVKVVRRQMGRFRYGIGTADKRLDARQQLGE